MQLTPRDLDVLEQIHTHRLLTQAQIHRRIFKGVDKSVSKRRLTLLFHQGYLGRIALPLRNAYGASRAVYFTEPKAVDLLTIESRIEQPIRARRDREREELFLRHTLAINDMRISVTLATATSGYGLLWWDEQELRRRGIRARLHDPEATLHVLPDAYFTVSARGLADGFALELDRGTVSEQRMRARFRAYGEWASAGAFRRDLPCESLRVMLVVDSPRDPRRLDRLKGWCEDERGGSLFWFAELADVAAAADLSDPIWVIAGSQGRQGLALSAAL